MAILDEETIKQLTLLCRIDCSEEEQKALLEDLRKIGLYRTASRNRYRTSTTLQSYLRVNGKCDAGR